MATEVDHLDLLDALLRPGGLLRGAAKAHEEQNRNHNIELRDFCRSVDAEAFILWTNLSGLRSRRHSRFSLPSQFDVLLLFLDGLPHNIPLAWLANVVSLIPVADRIFPQHA
jgi:hypothetical protein